MHTIGLFGGSFDPVHNAHIALAQAFAKTLTLGELRFLPAGQPWQKNGLKASASQRVDMLQLAIAELPPQPCRFDIDTRELQRSGATYTIDTLIDLRAEVGPAIALVFLIGADQLLKLHTWRRWQDLWSYAHIAAVTRPGSSVAELPEAIREEWKHREAPAATLHGTPHGHAFLLRDLDLDISATAIRTDLAHHKHNSDRLLPRPVLDYIQTHHLY
jgi:nicotinate-nucleotide adenylyltransferase